MVVLSLDSLSSPCQLSHNQQRNSNRSHRFAVPKSLRIRHRIIPLCLAITLTTCSSTLEHSQDAQCNVTASPLSESKPETTDKVKESTKMKSPMIHLAAGGIAGAVSRTCVAPLERLKICFQVQHVRGSVPKYTGIYQGLRTMYIEDGIRGYFMGNGINVLRIAPFTAVQFLSYDRYKRWMFGSDTDLSPLQRLFAGGCAGMTAAFATYPLDMMRARLTVGDASGICVGLREVLRTEGFIRGWYRGLWPTLVGVFPYIGIDFAVYDTLKPYMPRHPPKVPGGPPGDFTTTGILMCGAVAGMVAQTAAYPFDLIRRRMQVQRATDPNRYLGIWHGLKVTLKSEGIPGLYRGLIPNCLKAVPSLAISFAVYERAKSYVEEIGLFE